MLLKDCWLLNFEFIGWLLLKDCWLLNFEFGWLLNIDFVFVVVFMLFVWFMLFMGLFSWLNFVGFFFKFWNGLDGCCCCCCGCLGCWKFLDIFLVDVFEKGFGLLDILNEDELFELNLVLVLRFVLLLLFDGLNKLFNLFSVVYLFFVVFWVVVFLDVDISGLNLVFDVGCGCDGVEL